MRMQQWVSSVAVCLAVAWAAPAQAQDAAGAKPATPADDLKPATEPKYDVVTLNNGDTLRGTIKGADATKLTLTQALGDELVLSWKHIAGLLSTGSQTVRLKDGAVLKGILSPGPTAGRLSLDGGAAGRVPQIDIANIEGFGDPPQRPVAEWDGNIAIGVTVQDGNTREKTAFGSFDASRKSKNDLIEAHAHYKYTETRSVLTARNGNARLQYNYIIWDPTYVYVRGSFDYDRFANLNLRTRGGGGAGVQVLQEPMYKWRIEAGIEYTNEDLRGAPDERYAAARVATIFQWDPAKWFRFREFAEYFPNLEKGSDFTFRSESMLSVDLWGGFGLGISVIVTYDETPAPGTKHRADTTYTGTLTYKF